jgi:hypothetical protein
MVDVDVDDGDAIHAARDGGRCSDGGVVEQTETHRALSLRVMPGRAHECERRVALLDRELGRLNGSTGGKHRDFDARRGRKCVGIEHNGAAGGSEDLVDVRWRVHALDFFTARRARFDGPSAPLAPPRGNGIEHVCAFRPLGMSGGRDVFLETG